MARKLRGDNPTDREMLRIIDEAVNEFEGDAAVLESAIGALVVGRVVGWKALRLMHNGRTFKRYEEVLGVKFRDVLDEVTDQSERMMGYKLAQKMGKFWQAVSSGLIPAREAAAMERA